MLVVMLSWISFWIGAEATPERLSLGITCLLTMTVQNSALTDSLPPVTYIKAIDVWITVGTVFVLAALLEFVCIHVHILYHHRQAQVNVKSYRRKIQCRNISATDRYSHQLKLSSK